MKKPLTDKEVLNDWFRSRRSVRDVHADTKAMFELMYGDTSADRIRLEIQEAKILGIGAPPIARWSYVWRVVLILSSLNAAFYLALWLWENSL